MELLKNRDFSTFFTDTFKFIKENAKHFFVNYFIINGVFLLLSFVKNYLSGIEYTFPWMVEGFFILLLIVFGLINWTFVTVYMLLYNERKTDFDYKDILLYFRENISRILTFVFVSILMAIPAVIGFYIFGILIAITIVGVFLLPMLYAALILWFALTFYEYLNSDKSYFDSLGYGFTLFTKKIWATTGSTALLYTIVLLIYGLGLGVTGIFNSLLEMNTSDPTGTIFAIQKAFKSPAVLVVMSFLSVLMVLVQIGQGIIYFSQKEFLENINASKSIDYIGSVDE